MSHIPHELQEEFPELAAKIGRMKAEDAYFARLAEEYYEVNRAVHRAETNIDPVAERAEVEMRKIRAYLKDEISRLLAD